MNTRRRPIIAGALLLLIGLPSALALVVAVFFSILNPVILGVSNQLTGTLVSSGQRRGYLLYVPESYDPTSATPLVISMHAAAFWPAAQMKMSRWNEVAAQHGFIVVYPSGNLMTPFPLLPDLPAWKLRRDADLSENVTFISDLIDKLEATYNIDPTRIYANGFSNGGAMAFALSCRLAHRIAAVGTVSAAQDQQSWSWCADSPPMPLINFHGTADVVPYDGGRVWASPRPFPGVTAWTAEWARRNRCAPTPIESLIAPDVTRLDYMDCADDAAVVLYTIQGGGHAWPGGTPMLGWLLGSTTNDINASSLMWAFFRQHPLVAQSQ